MPPKPDSLKPFETNREHLSYSQVNLYKRCPWRFYLRYILNVPEDINLPMINGTAGHSALEINSKHKITTISIENPKGSDQSTEEILDNYSTALTKELSNFDMKLLEPGQSVDVVKDNTVQALTIWRAKFAPTIIPKAVELEFNVPVPPTEEFHDEVKNIVGKIDRIDQRDRIVTPNGRPVTRTTVTDEKFPMRLPSNLQLLTDTSLQLDTYDLVLSRANVQTNDLGYEHFVPPTKTIAARIISTFRTPALLTPARRAARHERTLFTYRTVSRAIRHGIFPPVDDPQKCATCPYRVRCQYSQAKKDYDAVAIRAKAGVT